MMWSEFGSRNNDIDLFNTSNTYRAEVTNTFKFRKKFELDAGLEWVQSIYKNDLNENDFVNWKPFIKGAWVVTDKLLFQTDYEFNNQFNNGEKINDNHSLNASLRYQPARKVYTYLTVGNLLNNDQYVSNGFNDFYTTITTRRTLGRYLIASVKYKF